MVVVVVRCRGGGSDAAHIHVYRTAVDNNNVGMDKIASASSLARKALTRVAASRIASQAHADQPEAAH